MQVKVLFIMLLCLMGVDLSATLDERIVQSQEQISNLIKSIKSEIVATNDQVLFNELDPQLCEDGFFLVDSTCNNKSNVDLMEDDCQAGGCGAREGLGEKCEGAGATNDK